MTGSLAHLTGESCWSFSRYGPIAEHEKIQAARLASSASNERGRSEPMTVACVARRGADEFHGVSVS